MAEHLSPSALIPAETGSLSKPRRLKLAGSLASASVGEVVLLDREGQVMRPKPLAWYEARAWTIAGAVAGLGGMTIALAGLPGLVGIAFFASCLGFFAWDRRQLHDLHGAVALASAGYRDEAWARFEELSSRRFNPALRLQVQLVMASLAWQRGHRSDALRRYEHIADLTRHSRRACQTYWLAQFASAQLLAIDGHQDRARRVVDHLTEAPHGDYFEWMRIVTSLAVAFHEDTTDDLPELLHDWAHTALEMNRSGYAIVGLAWAFHTRGDVEMATLMLQEAPSRLGAAFLPETDPALAAWFEMIQKPPE